MDNFNIINAKKELAHYLQEKLLNTIALMINNQVVSKSFIYVSNVEQFKNIFELVANKFNCNIDYVTHKKINTDRIASYECKIIIKPSSEHKVTFIYSELEEEYTGGQFTDDDW